jgi:hypothetical protein
MMKKHISLYTLLTFIYFTPTTIFAASCGEDSSGIGGLLCDFNGLIDPLTAFLAGLAVVYFVWGVGQFVLHDAGNDKTREDGKKKIMWGIIALFVLFFIWGIIGWLSGVFGVFPL